MAPHRRRWPALVEVPYPCNGLVMTTSGASRRAQVARVGETKAKSHRADTEAQLRLSPGDRIAATLRLSQAVLRMLPPGERNVDDAVEVWCRADQRLRAGRARRQP